MLNPVVASFTAMHPAGKRVCYEQPLNERVRTFLRLEFLFRQVAHSLPGKSEWDSRATLAYLIEILHIFSRGDIKTEVMKELERHAANLLRIEQKPNVDRTRLHQVLQEIDTLTQQLHTINGQIGQALRRNEFIMSIMQRSTIPGGTCDFDLPVFHHWLQRPSEERSHALAGWLASFSAIRLPVELILRLVRNSACDTREMAPVGFFQKTLDINLPCQMVRVLLPQDAPYFAEISGGKHRFTVRFLEQTDLAGRPVQVSHDVPFELSCCII